VLGKRRIQYEDELAHDARNYDVWFDFARLEEGALADLREEGAPADEEDGAIARVREVYERAIAQRPPGDAKRHWRRYIFLWLNYALFEELETQVRGAACRACSSGVLTCSQDYERARQVYRTAIEVVPHKQFTFAKLWLMYARFEVRRLDLAGARKLLGVAIGMCPKEALFKGYIQLELDVSSSTLCTGCGTEDSLQLREFDRVRTLYQKYLEARHMIVLTVRVLTPCAVGLVQLGRVDQVRRA
jgi:crooked neck